MTDRLALPPAYRRQLEALLREHVPDAEVWAYGSRVKGRSHEGSDLDLVLRGPTLEPLDGGFPDLLEAIQQSNIPILVQVHDWARLPKSFHKEIERDHVVVQKASSKTTARSEWHEVTVGHLAPFAYGKGLPIADRVLSGDVPVIGSGGIVGYHDRSLTDGPTIVIGRKGSVGTVHYSALPCWPIDTTFFVVGDDPDLLKFRYYALQALPLQEMNSDSAVPGLNRDAAHACVLRVPDEVEQRAIARVLSTLDDKIELNRRMCETLEEMARALFKSWFVDFEPVRAKMEGRWCPVESLPGLPADLYDLFPDRLVPSELGPIPEGWHIRSLDAIATFTNGLALQRFPPTGDEWLPVIKIVEMKRGYSEKTGRASSGIAPKYIVEDGDLLFSWSGSLELLVWTHGRGALNQHLFKVTSELPRWFCRECILIHLDDFREIAAGKATTMGHIKRHHLTDARVVVPPSSTIAHSGKLIAALDAQQELHGVQCRGLAALRDALLPRLVSGELRVPDALEMVAC